MRKLPQRDSRSWKTRSQAKGWLFALLTAFAILPGCSGGRGADASSNSPPSSSVTVSLSPETGTVLLGKTLRLTATVSGSSNTAVSWCVNGVSGGNSTSGTISAEGVYLAPADLPASPTIKITAASVASPASSASAQITVSSDISVGVSPNTASVELGAKQAFAATLTSSGQPDTTIHWMLTGAACPNACGTIDANGNYTAPQILPVPAVVTLTARSAADPAKQASISLTVTSRFTLQLSAPETVTTSATAVIFATLTPISGSNPATIINWSLSGAGCSASACGTLSSVTTQSTGANSPTITETETANYTAPGAAPAPNTVIITATPQADPAKRAQATIAVQPGVGVTLTPITATVSANHRLTLSVQVNGSSNSTVLWTVSAIAGGNSSVGKICVLNSNPCTTVTSSNVAQVDYLAPGAIPIPNPSPCRQKAPLTRRKARPPRSPSSITTLYLFFLAL